LEASGYYALLSEKCFLASHSKEFTHSKMGLPNLKPVSVSWSVSVSWAVHLTWMVFEIIQTVRNIVEVVS